MWRMQDMAGVFSASSFRDSNGRETDARFSICEFKVFRLIHKVSTAKSRAAPCIRRTVRANLPEYHPTTRNVPAPHPASRHAIARVLHATRCECTSSSRPDAAPSAASTKTRRDVPKSSRELRKKSQLSAKNGTFSSRLLHPAARTPRLERHGAPFSVCTGLSPWRAPRRNTVCAHRMAENRKENYSRKRSFLPLSRKELFNISFLPRNKQTKSPSRPKEYVPLAYVPLCTAHRSSATSESYANNIT